MKDGSHNFAKKILNTRSPKFCLRLQAIGLRSCLDTDTDSKNSRVMAYYHNLWSRQRIEAVTQTLFHPFKTGYFKLFYFLFPFLCIFFCSFVTIVDVINSFIRTLPIICQRPQPGRLTAYCFKISNQRSFLVLCCCCDYCHFDFLNWGALCFFLNYELQDPVFLGSSHGVF